MNCSRMLQEKEVEVTKLYIDSESLSSLLGCHMNFKQPPPQQKVNISHSIQEELWIVSGVGMVRLIQAGLLLWEKVCYQALQRR